MLLTGQICILARLGSRLGRHGHGLPQNHSLQDMLCLQRIYTDLASLLALGRLKLPSR